jgi:hypothetical protein
LGGVKMARDYSFNRIIDRAVDEARTCDSKIEGHYADISQQLRDISHFLSLKRDDDETIKEARYYVPGILNQNSVKFEFHNRAAQQVEAMAVVHTTGLFQGLNRQLAEKLEALGYK